MQNRISKKNNDGFTLIEMVIYIALFSLLLGSAFITAYQIIESVNKTNIKTATQEEGNFISRKLDWVLTGLDRTPANLPTVSGTGCNQTLTVNKLSSPENPISIKLNSGNNSLEINKAGGAFVPITSVNVQVTCFKARIIPSLGTGPSGVTATTTISDIDFSVTKYFRK